MPGMRRNSLNIWLSTCLLQHFSMHPDVMTPESFYHFRLWTFCLTRFAVLSRLWSTGCVLATWTASCLHPEFFPCAGRQVKWSYHPNEIIGEHLLPLHLGIQVAKLRSLNTEFFPPALHPQRGAHLPRAQVRGSVFLLSFPAFFLAPPPGAGIFSSAFKEKADHLDICKLLRAFLVSKNALASMPR